ncbi:hypothetical protein D3C73_906310 [compost metagenome]
MKHVRAVLLRTLAGLLRALTLLRTLALLLAVVGARTLALVRTGALTLRLCRALCLWRRLVHRHCRLRARLLRSRLCCGFNRARSRGCRGRDRGNRLFVLRAGRAAFHRFDDDRFRAAATHVLAHSTLVHAGWLEREGLLHAECLVVFVVGHSVPVPSYRNGWKPSEPVVQVV